MNGHFANYAEERERLLQRICSVLATDDRIAAAWLAGSIGHGTSDDLSDLDIWVAVANNAVQEIMAAPEALIHTIVPTILEVPAPSIAPPGGAFLLTWVAGAQGPQQVDWYFTPVASTNRPSDTHLLFAHVDMPDRRPPSRLTGAELDRAVEAAISDVLLMLFVTSKHIARNNRWDVTRHLEHIARSLGALGYLLDHGTRPPADLLMLHLLPETIPATQAEQMKALRMFRAKLGEMLDRSTNRKRFSASLQAIDLALDARSTPSSGQQHE